MLLEICFHTCNQSWLCFWINDARFSCKLINSRLILYVTSAVQAAIICFYLTFAWRFFRFQPLSSLPHYLGLYHFVISLSDLVFFFLYRTTGTKIMKLANEMTNDIKGSLKVSSYNEGTQWCRVDPQDVYRHFRGLAFNMILWLIVLHLL